MMVLESLEDSVDCVQLELQLLEQDSSLLSVLCHIHEWCWGARLFEIFVGKVLSSRLSNRILQEWRLQRFFLPDYHDRPRWVQPALQLLGVRQPIEPGLALLAHSPTRCHRKKINSMLKFASVPSRRDYHIDDEKKEEEDGDNNNNEEESK